MRKIYHPKNNEKLTFRCPNNKYNRKNAAVKKNSTTAFEGGLIGQKARPSFSHQAALSAAYV